MKNTPNTIAMLSLLCIALTAQAASYTYLKLDDAPVGPYEAIGVQAMTKAGAIGGALLYIGRTRSNGQDRCDIIVSDGVIRFAAMTHASCGIIPRSLTSDGYFAWATGTEVYAGYDATSAVLVAGAADGFIQTDLDNVVINDNHLVAFTGTRADGTRGVFTRNMMGGPIVTMAQTGKSFAGRFLGISMNEAGLVAFFGQITVDPECPACWDRGLTGIFVSDGTTITPIVLSTDPLVGHPYLWTSINDLGDVVLTDWAFGHPFIGNGSAPPRPASSRRTSGFPIINNFGSICFVNWDADCERGICSAYIVDSTGVETRVLGQSDGLWGYAVTPSFVSGFNDAGQVAMLGRAYFGGGINIVMRADPVP